MREVFGVGIGPQRELLGDSELLHVGILNLGQAYCDEVNNPAEESCCPPSHAQRLLFIRSEEG